MSQAQPPTTKQTKKQNHYPVTIAVALNRPLRREFDYLPSQAPIDTTNTLPAIGARVAVPFRNKTLIGIVTAIKYDQTSPYTLKPVERIIDAEPVIATQTLTLARWLSRYYQQPLGEVLHYCLPTLLRKGEPLLDLSERYICAAPATVSGQTFDTYRENLPARARQQHQILDAIANHTLLAYSDVTSKPALARLLDKGVVANTQRAAIKPRFHARQHLVANAAQQHAIDAITATRAFACHLVDGITGSGKTEVYLQAMQPVVEKQRQVLMLVPEIGLIPQLASRVNARFDCVVTCLHSQLSPKQKLKAWQQVSSGYSDVIIGTRSALFAAMPQLGLIIIDEEHDLSFKQQDGVRFHARDCAIQYAKQRDIPIVLGSATPSIETLHNALEGRFSHLELPAKANADASATIELLPLDENNLFHGLHPKAVLQAKQILQSGRQVLFFLNRRGYAPVIMCRSCDWIAECTHCDAKLTYHKKSHQLTCHHCGARQRLSAKCPSCFESELVPVGEGTEQIEEALQKALGDWPIVRIDSDVIHSQAGFQEKLAPIMAGEPCVLLGTQMLTKGHHFPHLALVVVVNADGGLYSANFRAPEQLLQQLIQVSGRTGRESEGKVIIQTQFAQHPVFEALIRNTYHSYAKQIIAERKHSGLPPFQYTAIIRAEHTQASQAEAFCQQIAHTANQWIQQNSLLTAVLGPAPVLMTRLNNAFRYQLLFLSPARAELNSFLRSLCLYIEGLKMPISRWHIDVDPLEFI